MSTNRAALVPRSIWPRGIFRVSAWHEDKHISRLLEAHDQLTAVVGFAHEERRVSLPADALTCLLERALSSPSVYEATAAMDYLHDAYEDFPVILDRIEGAVREAPEGHDRRRMAGCLEYLALHYNRRPFLGKPHEDVLADANHFRRLADRAKTLTDRLLA